MRGVVRVLVACLAVTIAASLVPHPDPVAASTGLVSRWSMDEGAGDAVADVVGTAPGTRAGAATWLGTAIQGASALAFDGATSRVDIPGSPALEPSELTLSAWIRGDPENPPAVGSVIVEKGAFACDGPSFGMAVGDEGIVLRYQDPHFGPQSRAIPSSWARTSLWDGAWHLVAVSVPRGPGDAKVQMDGLTVSAGMTWSSAWDDHLAYSGATSSAMRIGAAVAEDCGTPAFGGDIDDVHLWDDALAIHEAANQMPPISTTTVMQPPVAIHPEEGRSIAVAVTPAPRMGAVRIQIVEPGSGDVVNTDWAYLDATGHGAGGGIFFPSIAGTYDVVATFVGIAPYQTSTDTAHVEVTLWPTTTRVAVAPSSPLPTAPLTVTADVTGGPEYGAYPTGSVTFVDSASGADVILGSATLVAQSWTSARATLALPDGLGIGAHSFVARYDGDTKHDTSVSAALGLAIGSAPSTTSAWGPGEVETHHPVQLEASIGVSIDGWAADTTMTFTREGQANPVCVVPMTTENHAVCTVASLPVGMHAFRATYSGNSLVSGSQSEPVTVSVLADHVDVNGVGVSSTSIYPYKDGYRDTVAIRGQRLEAVGVVIRIYSPTGSLVKSSSVARATGAYAASWNGRSSTGSILAAGRYRVVQTLTDAAGTRKSVTAYVALSRKRLYTYTTYVTRAGSAVATKGTSGSGSVVISASRGTVTIKAPGSYWQNWAGVGYQFTLPSATVYSRITFQVYRKGEWWAAPNELMVQNFKTCPLVSGEWDTSCFDHESGLAGSTVPAWVSTGASPTNNRSGRTVRGAVSIVAGTFTIYKARVKVTYGLLK